MTMRVWVTALTLIALQNIDAKAEVVSVPCAGFGGSGGVMFEKTATGAKIPAHWYPLVILKAQEYPIRSKKMHPMYSVEHPDAFYATCAVVPSKYP